MVKIPALDCARNFVLHLVSCKREILNHYRSPALQHIAMCLIKFGADQEEKDLVIPNRPVTVDRTPPSHSRHSLGGAAHPRSPNDPGNHGRERTLSSGSQAVVIQQLSSQGSTTQKDGLSPKSAIPANRTYQRNGLLKASPDMSQGPQRKSGSLSHGRRTPRQSNASFRTTRERIVVVDDTGRRREYYRRDDSGR